MLLPTFVLFLISALFSSYRISFINPPPSLTTSLKMDRVSPKDASHEEAGEIYHVHAYPCHWYRQRLALIECSTTHASQQHQHRYLFIVATLSYQCIHWNIYRVEHAVWHTFLIFSNTSFYTHLICILSFAWFLPALRSTISFFFLNVFRLFRGFPSLHMAVFPTG